MSAGKFNVNDKVLCYHGPRLYRARVLEAQMEGEKQKIRVHYEGWNQKWDEWVPEDRVLEVNEQSLEKQKELEEKAGPKKSRRSRGPLVRGDKDGTGTNSRPSSPSVDDFKPKSSRASTGSDYNIEPRRKRPRVDPYMEYETQYLSRAEVKVHIPEELKPILVDDWDYITHQMKLIRIPVSPDKTVRAILDSYLRHKTAEVDPLQLDFFAETVHGVKEYFEVMLGTQLLYKFERLQYTDFIQSDKSTKLCDVYGFVHLLRLFVRLGNMLSFTTLTERNIELVLRHVADLLSYLQQNKASFYASADYQVAPPEYTRRSFA